MVNPELYIWLAVLLFLLGLLALILEIFIVPGFGVPGIAGIIFIGWGIILLSVDIAQTTMSLALALIATLVIFVVGIKLSTRYNLWQKITLNTKQANDSGYSSSQPSLVEFEGSIGVALTPLRPAGTIEVSGKRLDVVTGGEYIPAGTSVMVIKVEGARVVVREVH